MYRNSVIRSAALALAISLSLGAPSAFAADQTTASASSTVVQRKAIAQGLAQALFEEVAYDGFGNNVTGSLMSYAMPSSSDLPTFETTRTETPTDTPTSTDTPSWTPTWTPTDSMSPTHTSTDTPTFTDTPTDTDTDTPTWSPTADASTG